jgi:hypothetical protein
MLKPLLTIALPFAIALYCASSALAQTQSAPLPSPTPSPQPGAFGEQYDGKWHIGITPYIWAPTLNGTFHFTNAPAGRLGFEIPSSVDVTTGPNKYLTHFNSAGMLNLQIRKNDSAIILDGIYLNFSNATTNVTTLRGPHGIVVIPITASASSRLSGGLWTVELSQNLARTDSASINVLFGGRALIANTTVDWSLRGPLGNFSPTGSVSQFANEFTPVLGLNGKIGLGPHFFIPYYGDYGANANLYTWQGLLGFGYGYHSGAVTLAWRQLIFDSTNSAAIFQKLSFGGPALGWTFRL